MIDQYGILPALQSALVIYDGMSRGTGRTTHMLAQVKDDDLIICRPPTYPLDWAVKERGLKNVVVAPCDVDFGKVVERFAGHSRGQIHFTHEWMTEFYKHRLVDIHQEFAYLREHFKQLTEPKPTPMAARLGMTGGFE